MQDKNDPDWQQTIDRFWKLDSQRLEEGTPKLTPREEAVLRCYIKGLSQKETAKAMGSAEGTVRNQTSSIFAKLNVTTRQAAIRVYYQEKPGQLIDDMYAEEVRVA